MTQTSQETCVVVRGGSGTYAGRQGLDYFHGVSAETAGARGLCMHLLVIPPGGAGRPHLHEGHESAVYVISGEGGMRHGPGLAHRATASAGDFVHIPANVPHQPYNASETEPLRAVVARTDPNEQESVVLLDDEGRPLPAQA